MKSHFNKLTPAEDERLALVAEECAEVIKAVAKIQRHGYASSNPFDVGGDNNREALTRECGDLAAAIGLLNAAKDINGEALVEYAAEKLCGIEKWLHRQPVALLRTALKQLKASR